MDRRNYWDQVYESKPLNAVSWYQQYPQRSIDYIQKYSRTSEAVIDVGAGASYLIDALVGAGYANLIALDVSASALERVRLRLSSRGAGVRWVVADLTESPGLSPVDLWHDRATLHFLTSPEDQAIYAQLAAKTIKPGGHLVLATFAPEGPERCSGLPVARHSGASLTKVFANGFVLLEESRDRHVTPSGNEQLFCWTVFLRRY